MIYQDSKMRIDGLSFEGFFNAVHNSLERDGYKNPGRTAMNAGSFQLSGPLDLLPLRALQFGVAYLVNEQELPEDYNAKASAVITVADAHTLMNDININARKQILHDLS